MKKVGRIGSSADRATHERSHSAVSSPTVGVPCAALPDVLAGHWSTPDGHEMASEYLTKRREDLMMGHMSDLELANAVYLAGRFDIGLLPLQTAAKERIRWLSAQLASARSAEQSS